MTTILEISICSSESWNQPDLHDQHWSQHQRLGSGSSLYGVRTGRSVPLRVCSNFKRGPAGGLRKPGSLIYSSQDQVTSRNSIYYLGCVRACVLSPFSCVSLWPRGLKPTRLLCPWGFPRQEHWSRLPCPSPGDLSDPGIEPTSLTSPSLAGGFFTASTTREAQCLGWQVHISNYWFTERSMPSSKLRGDLSKACHEQRGKQSQQRWRSGYDRKQASVQSCCHLPRGSRDASSIPAPLYMRYPVAFKDPPPARPCGTVPWECQPTSKLTVLTVTSSCELQDFLLQLRPQQFRAASVTASSALLDAATQVLPKAALLGLHAIPPFLLSQWNPVTFSQMMNWKLHISVTNFSFYIIKLPFSPLRRHPALWGQGLTRCANGADLSLWLRWAQRRGNYSCVCSCGCAQLTDFK